MIMSGKRPEEPERRRTNEQTFELLWKCCNACWSYEAVDRPRMAGVKELIKEISACRFTESGRRMTWRVQRMFGLETISKVLVGWCWMSPTGRFLAVSSNDEQTISFIDSKTTNQCGPDLRQESVMWSVAWSSTEDCVVTNSADGVVRKWRRF